MLTERGRLAREEFKAGETPALLAFAAESVSPYAPLPPREAIKWFKNLIPITNEAFDSLVESAREFAFKLAGVTELRALESVKTALQTSLETGSTLRDFNKELERMLSPEVFNEMSGWHVETVFRTNLHSAYSAGQYEQLHDPDVVDAFPVFRYETVGDDRVREAHAHMNNVTLPADDPIWQKWWPPNGYNCRCSIVPISKKSAKDLKLTRRSDLVMQGPDAGFEGPPAGLAERFTDGSAARLTENLRGGLGQG